MIKQFHKEFEQEMLISKSSAASFLTGFQSEESSRFGQVAFDDDAWK